MGMWVYNSENHFVGSFYHNINLVISEVFIAAENDTIDQYSLLTLSNDR